MDAEQFLIDPHRVGQIREIGHIDGGQWADVLAVSYGPGDTVIRVRCEQTGERREYLLPEGMTLAERLEMFAEALYLAFPFTSKPVVTMYRGHQARKWAKRLIADIERAIKAAEAAGMTPNVGDDGVPTYFFVRETPSEPTNRLN